MSDQQGTATSETAKEINIDINGDQDAAAGQVGSSSMKNMSADDGARVGLTKEELMKYANDPFWIRLRNILFATFWIVWVSILVAAIGYVVSSPVCKASAAAVASPSTNSTSSG